MTATTVCYYSCKTYSTITTAILGRWIETVTSELAPLVASRGG
jgi:hypothetical protein